MWCVRSSSSVTPRAKSAGIPCSCRSARAEASVLGPSIASIAATRGCSGPMPPRTRSASDSHALQKLAILLRSWVFVSLTATWAMFQMSQSLARACRPKTSSRALQSPRLETAPQAYSKSRRRGRGCSACPRASGRPGPGRRGAHERSRRPGRRAMARPAGGRARKKGAAPRGARAREEGEQREREPAATGRRSRRMSRTRCASWWHAWDRGASVDCGVIEWAPVKAASDTPRPGHGGSTMSKRAPSAFRPPRP